MTALGLKRRIILHAGFHKTGTTSLQSCLRDNAGKLPKGWRVQSRPDSVGLRAVVEAARDYSASRDKADLGMVSAQTVLWLGSLDLQPGEGILISSEDFAGHMPGRFGVKDYAALAQILPAVIGTARRFFGGGKVAIDVLITTRQAEPWLRSLHFQQSKHPDLLLDFAAFCQSLPAAADHQACVRDLRAALGDVPVTLRGLEELSQLRLGPAQAMYDLAGIDARAFVPSQLRNTTPAPGLAEAYVRANQMGLPGPELKRMKEELAKAAVSSARKLG
jgi:hypothetical protein